MLYNRCTGIYKFGNNTYPRRIRRGSNLGHIFRGKKCVLWAGKYGNLENCAFRWFVLYITTHGAKKHEILYFNIIVPFNLRPPKVVSSVHILNDPGCISQHDQCPSHSTLLHK